MEYARKWLKYRFLNTNFIVTIFTKNRSEY